MYRVRGLLERDVPHPMTLKTIRPLDETAVARLRDYLTRWRLLDMQPPHRTMFHAHPLDFGEVDGAEVWIVDFVLGLPVPADVIADDVADLWRVPRKAVVCMRRDEGRRRTEDEARARESAETEIAVGEVTAGSVFDRGGDYAPLERGLPGRLFAGDDWNRRLLDGAASVRRETEPVFAADWAVVMREPKVDTRADPPDLRPGDARAFLDGHGAKPVYAEDPPADDPAAADLGELISRWGNIWRAMPTVRHVRTSPEGRSAERAATDPALDRLRSRD